MSWTDWIYLLAAVAAVATFFWRVKNANRISAQTEKRAWQEVVVQRYLVSVDRQGAKFQEILHAYRSEAQARPKELSRDELTEPALRRVLVSLVYKRVVEQLSDDRYRVSCPNDAVENIQESMADGMLKMLGTQAELVADHGLKRQLYAAISKSPFEMTVPELILEVSEKGGATPIEIQSLLAQEIARQRLRTNEELRVGFGPLAKSEE